MISSARCPNSRRQLQLLRRGLLTLSALVAVDGEDEDALRQGVGAVAQYPEHLREPVSSKSLSSAFVTRPPSLTFHPAIVGAAFLSPHSKRGRVGAPRRRDYRRRSCADSHPTLSTTGCYGLVRPELLALSARNELPQEVACLDE